MLAFLSETGALGVLRKSATSPRVSRLCSPRRFRTSAVRAAVPAPVPLVQENAQSSVDKYLEAGMGVVVLKRGKARLFREGRNPMVFAGAVERTIPPPGGTLDKTNPVAVCDGALRCLGYGFFNASSMFRVRLLRHIRLSDEGETVESLPWNYEEDILRRLRDAVSLREAIGFPSVSTNVYRVVNGEGDRLSGLVVDRVENTLVVSTSALWCESYAAEILRSLEKVLPECEDVIWRPHTNRLRQDGFEIDEDEKEKEQTVPGLEQQGTNAREASSGDDADGNEPTLIVSEAGVKYELSRFALTKGQKTGHYADQRENRTFVRELVTKNSSNRVLDLFCYSGGFAVSAALGNSNAVVTAIDSSARAVDMGRRNAELNGVAERVEFKNSDVMKFLKSAPAEDRESFDMVIVDPPKYAPNAKTLLRATHKYRSLNMAAMRMVKQGGLFCTCSCSAAMTQDRSMFVEMVRQAGGELGRELTLVKTFGAGADHPITPEMPECEYLTMCIFVCR